MQPEDKGQRHTNQQNGQHTEPRRSTSQCMRNGERASAHTEMLYGLQRISQVKFFVFEPLQDPRTLAQWHRRLEVHRTRYGTYLSYTLECPQVHIISFVDRLWVCSVDSWCAMHWLHALLLLCRLCDVCSIVVLCLHWPGFVSAQDLVQKNGELMLLVNGLKKSLAEVNSVFSPHVPVQPGFLCQSDKGAEITRLNEENAKLKAEIDAMKKKDRSNPCWFSAKAFPSSRVCFQKASPPAVFHGP